MPTTALSHLHRALHSVPLMAVMEKHMIGFGVSISSVSTDALEQKTHRSTEKSLHVARMLFHGIITMGIYVSCLCCWLVCLH